MKRLFSLFKKKVKKTLYHINYSRYEHISFSAYVGTVRGLDESILGQFIYFPTEFGAVLRPYGDKVKTYFIAKTPESDFAYADAFIHPDFGGMENAHSLREFLKKEFAI